MTAPAITNPKPQVARDFKPTKWSDIEAWTRRSREQQGLPLRITNERAIEKMATLYAAHRNGGQR